ncbi:MAG: hypothetical protein GY739_05920 [Mesoflavibacter sp.]|nr:hypothetical protein [Mesoflavibacter sp.]
MFKSDRFIDTESIEQFLYRQNAKRKVAPKKSAAEAANEALALASLPAAGKGAKTAAGNKKQQQQQQQPDYLHRIMSNMDQSTKDQMLKHSIIIAYCHCQNVTIRRDS